MIFKYYNFNTSDQIVLKYSNEKYIITFDKKLFDVKRGKIYYSLEEKYQEIEKVFDINGKIKAIKKEGILHHYDPINHNEKVQEIKKQNKLYTRLELLNKFKQDCVSHSCIDSELYKNERTIKLIYNQIPFSVKVCEKQVFAKTYGSKGAKKLNLLIKRYLINKKNEIYLYSYQSTLDIFS